MGRTKPSAGLPPASFRKDARAKKARATINKVIPSLLPSHPRTRDGIARTEMFTPESFSSLPSSTSSASPTAPNPLRITLRTTTTLIAAHHLVISNSIPPTRPKDKDKVTKVAILNMASPLSPGGGFFSGASSQEESLCMHTTLLPALRDEFYRLPELSAVLTADVLVFREDGHQPGSGSGMPGRPQAGEGGAGPDGGQGGNTLDGKGVGQAGQAGKKTKPKTKTEDDILPKPARWYVDVVTAAMLRQPEVSDQVYTNDSDRELVRRKMRLVMRVFGKAEARKVVLGAWGCGAYGNPVGEVARAWRDVLTGRRDGWEGVEEVVFAVKERGMAERFAEAFGEGLVRDEDGDEGDGGEDESEEDDGGGELGGKIKELETAMEAARSPQLKEGLARAVARLREQMRSNRGDD